MVPRRYARIDRAFLARPWSPPRVREPGRQVGGDALQ